MYVLFRNDDPCALSDPALERRVCQLFEKYNIPFVAAVVPRMVDDPHNDKSECYQWLDKNQEMVSLLKEYRAKGLMEIAQHGFLHQTNRFHPTSESISPEDHFQGIDKKWLPYVPASRLGYSEFAELPLAEQREKIINGKKYLQDILGIQLKSFIFPWNTYDQNTLQALQEAGFTVALTDTAPIRKKDLFVVGAYNWRVASYPSIIRKFSKFPSIFVQLGFHSWMMDEKDFAALEETLQLISERGGILCLTADQVPAVIPEIQSIATFSHISERLSKKVNPYLKKAIPARRYYWLRKRHYMKRIFRKGLIWTVMQFIGLNKMLIIPLVLFCLVNAASFIYYQTGGQQNFFLLIASLLCAGLLVAAVVLREKIRVLVIQSGPKK